MHAHAAVCLKCDGGVVKMARNSNGDLNPDHVWCLKCGQAYFMKIENLKDWEAEQWEQKRVFYREVEPNRRG